MTRHPITDCDPRCRDIRGQGLTASRIERTQDVQVVGEWL